MDYNIILSLVADILTYAFPISLIFGLVAKLTNFTLSMILDKKIEL